jgi:hypothetical protein
MCGVGHRRLRDSNEAVVALAGKRNALACSSCLSIPSCLFIQGEHSRGTLPCTVRSRGRNRCRSVNCSIWPEGVYSIARFELHADGKGTKLVFDHDGFPEDMKEHLANGSQSNYWEKLSKHPG